MARMVRKQIYITEEQEQRLKRMANESGLSEADIIRRHLDESERLEIWQKELAYMRERAKMKVPQTGRQWTRDELYEERFERYSG